MDDLDRMFRRLVQNIRNGYPDYFRRPFEVAELYQNLIPYRHNRRELEIETNQDYEIALCRLLAGERGYLMADDLLADVLRRELASANPNTAVFRDFAASHVSLAPTAERQWEALGGDIASVPTLATPATPAASDINGSWTGRGAATATADRTAAAPRAAASAAAASTGSCRYCGGTLPSGRQAMFCPQCGQNLTIQRCPACGTELELNWKFCITCGRGVAGS